MLLDELASELVELTSTLVSGRTINIMNTDGIIIASSDPARIGSYHHGAKEAVLKGATVNIYRDQLNYYHGAKEGCNMPIRIGGVIIGVIGIYGDPDEIRDMAHLLEVYASKYYQLEAMLRPVSSESAMRSTVVANLLSPQEDTVSNARTLMDRLQIGLEYPVYVTVIEGPEPLTLEVQMEHLLGEMKKHGFPDKRRDIWGVLNERMVLFSSTKEGRSIRDLKALTDSGYRLAVGRACATLWEIRTAYHQAAVLERSGEDAFQEMSDPMTRCRYLLYESAGEGADLLNGLVSKFTEAFSPEEQLVLIESAKTYYESDRSISAAASKLFVHKNTLQYRIKRILKVLDIEDFPPFWQEYLLRLLFQRYQTNSKLQSLE